MPDLPKTLVKLAAEFVKHQGKKHFGERFLVTASEMLTEFAGDTVTEKITNFVDQGERLRNPAHSDHRFRRIPITDSGAFRSPIPAIPITASSHGGQRRRRPKLTNQRANDAG